MTSLIIRGGQVLRAADDRLTRCEVRIDADTISGFDDPQPATPNDERIVDADGALVLPGIVDIHGDAFERALMPRGGVMLDVAAALADNDVALLGAGITTAYLSITDSWEPGLRSRSTLRALLDANDGLEGGPDRFVHVRHERCHTDGFDELLGWVEQRRVRMISYNDHTPGGIAPSIDINATRLERSGVTAEEFARLQADAVARRDIGRVQDERLAEVCRTVGCVTASHDAGDPADLERDRRLGVSIAEFPLTLELARRYLDCGIEVLMGAPNLVRGTSHLGNVSVRDAIADGATTLLCSDYHYPSLLQSPFVLAETGIRSFAAGWDLVSGAPARAAGLTDRGRLAVGTRADVIIVEPPGPGRAPRVRAAVVGGRPRLEVATR